MINRVVLLGRITKDPEIKYTQSNIPVVTFTLAVNKTYKDANGERQADFIQLVAWRNSAEFLSRYVKKGNMLGVEGRIQTRSYEADGAMRYITEVVVDSVQLLESKNQGDIASQPYQPRPQQSTYQNSQPTYQPQQPYYNQNYNNQSFNRTQQEDNFSSSDISFDVADDDLPF